MLKQGIRLSGLLCGVVSLNSMAFSLGGVQYRSYIDEPLEATIELLGVEVGNESLILVEPASVAEYARLGLERRGLVTSLSTEVSRLPSGKWVVHLSTSKPVDGAQINLALRAQWVGGAVVQKYTLLLSEPPEQFLIDENALIYEVAQGELEMLEAESTESMQDIDSAKVWNVDDGASKPSERRVASGQSLSDVAVSLRPANTVSVDQMMVAIANKNSDVFVDGLFSELEMGQLLKVPDSSEINSIERSEARRTVALETLRAGIAESESVTPKPAEPPTSQRGILRLGSSDQSELPVSTNSRGKKVQSKNFKGSRTDLGRRLDNVLERLEDANGIINGHLTEIEALNLTVADLSHTIELKNSELARMLQAVSVLESNIPASNESSGQSKAQEHNSGSEQADSRFERERLEAKDLAPEEAATQPWLSRFSLALIAFFASVLSFLTLSRWRNSRAEAISYDPLSEEMAMQEKADAVAKSTASKLSTAQPSITKLTTTKSTTTRPSTKSSIKYKSIAEPTTQPVSLSKTSVTSTTAPNQQTKTKLNTVAKAANDNTDKSLIVKDKVIAAGVAPGKAVIQTAANAKSEVSGKEQSTAAQPVAKSRHTAAAAPSVSISVSIPVSTQKLAKQTIVNANSEPKDASDNNRSDSDIARVSETLATDASRITGMLDANETMLDDVADEFDASAPIPWSPPQESMQEEEASDQGDSDDGDVATLSRSKVRENPIAPIASKAATDRDNQAVLTSAASATAVNYSQPIQAEAHVTDELALDVEPAVNQVSDLDLLLNDDLGFGSELTASPLETAQAYIELDDIDAAIRVLNEIIADSSAAEHTRATQLLVDLRS